MAFKTELRDLVSVSAKLSLMLPLCLAIFLKSDKVLGQTNISQASQSSQTEEPSSEQRQVEQLDTQEIYSQASSFEESECSDEFNYASCVHLRYQQRVTEDRQSLSASTSDVKVINLQKGRISDSPDVIYKKYYENNLESVESSHANCTDCSEEYQQQQIFEYHNSLLPGDIESFTQSIPPAELSNVETVISSEPALRQTQFTIEDSNSLSGQAQFPRNPGFKHVDTSLKSISVSKIITENEKLLLSATETLPSNRSDTSCESTSTANERGECYLQLRQDAEKSLANARNPTDEAQAFLSLGNAYLGLEEYEKARQSFQDALERYGSAFPDGRANALIGIALSSREPGSTSEAIAQAEEAFNITTTLQLASQPSRLLRLATFFYGLSEAGGEQKNGERALELSHQAFQISSELGNVPQEVISSLVLLGAIYSSLERYSDAVAVYEQLPSLYQSTENRVGQINALIILGDAYMATESYTSARTVLEKVSTIIADNDDSSAEDRARVLLKLAEVYFNLGLAADFNKGELFTKAEESATEARRLFREKAAQAKENGEEISANTQAGIARSLEVLSNIYFAQGQYSDGLDSLTEMFAIPRELADRVSNNNDVQDVIENVSFIGDAIGVLQIFFPPLRAINVIVNIASLLSIADDVPILYESFTDILRGVRSHVRRDRRSEITQSLEEQLRIIRNADSHNDDSRKKSEELDLLTQLGILHLNFQEYQEAEKRFEEVLSLVGESNNDSSFVFIYQAEALLRLGEIASAQGDTGKARENSARALELFKRLQEATPAEAAQDYRARVRAGEARTRLSLSTIAFKIGDYSQALSEGEISLQLFQGLGKSYLAEQAETQIVLGRLHLRLRRYDTALSYVEGAQDIYQQISDPVGQGSALLVLSDLYRNLGQYQDSLESSRTALRLFQNSGDQSRKAEALLLIGTALQAQRRFREASKAYELAYDLQEEVEARVNPQEGLIPKVFRGVIVLANSVLNIFVRNPFDLSDAHRFVEQLGTVVYFTEGAFAQLGLENDYISSGENIQAEEYFKRSQKIAERLGDRIAEAQAMLGLSNLYLTQNNYADAQEEAQEALNIFQSTDDRSGEAYALLVLSQASLGRGKEEKESLQRRDEYYDQAIAYAQEASIVLQINISQLLPQPIQPSHPSQQESHSVRPSNTNSSLSRCEVDDRYGMSLAHSSIGDVLAAQANIITDDESAKSQGNALAIIFYKKAVVCREEIRQEVVSLSPRLQRAYVGTLVETYRRLVDLLLQENRVEEALQVMELLRVQEVEDFLRTTRQNLDVPELYVHPGEDITLEAYLDLQQEALKIIRARRVLYEARKQRSLTSEEDSRWQELDDGFPSFQQFLTRQFVGFVNSPDIKQHLAALSDIARDRNIPIRDLEDFSTTVEGIEERVKANVVLLYPVSLIDRLELIVVVPGAAPINVPIEDAGRVNLNNSIALFLDSLNNFSDQEITQNYAQKLYNWLIQPIEQFLPPTDDRGEAILLYAPDSQLRYIPLAALHDGNQWLAERFQINYFTGRSVYGLLGGFPPRPRVFAGAVTQNSSITVQGQTYPFDSLSFAGSEVSTIASLVTPDQISLLLDESLTRDAVLDQMDENDVVHFATHAQFSLQGPEFSFILLGDNQYISLADFKQESEQEEGTSRNSISGGLRFPNIDLIVLSACDTAKGIADRDRTTDDASSRNGEEILSFGYLMQDAGIRAAISSLWKISDGGTMAFMRVFYEGLLQQGMTSSEALTRAQRILIGTSDFSNERHELIQQLTDQGVPPEVVMALNHPSFWAPFILIGNGLW